MKKILYTIMGLTVLGSGIAFAAPWFNYSRSFLPIDSTENLGTTTAPWDELHVNEVCLSADCKTAWPTGGGGGSGSGTFATSTAWGSILYNYPLNASDVVTIGYDGAGVATSTNEAEWVYDPIAKIGSMLGKWGIGTTSPYATLSVVGQTVSDYFTATSTSATSTF